ncbi:hypothetical protein B0H14DRAFT_2358564 [Mycena olivaceomarginata]|nr:hypothetical protein B0H14DRAFT_2358564 [Mycena olivaceomarginata]
MDKIREAKYTGVKACWSCIQKTRQIRAETDATIACADEIEVKDKKLEQRLFEKGGQCRAQGSGAFFCGSRGQEKAKQINETLARKIQLLEDEIAGAESKMKATIEKLREAADQVEHSERQVLSVEIERDRWEEKYWVSYAVVWYGT